MSDDRRNEGQAPGGRRQGRGHFFRSSRKQEAAKRPDQASAEQRPNEKNAPVERPASQAKPVAVPAFSCELCQKPIYDLTGALSDRETGLPVHFDCALERVTAAETLLPGEKIAYLGSGCFGVVVCKDKPDGAFTVVRRIQWEKEGEKKEWRKLLSSGILRI